MVIFNSYVSLPEVSCKLEPHVTPTHRPIFKSASQVLSTEAEGSVSLPVYFRCGVLKYIHTIIYIYIYTYLTYLNIT